MSTSTDSISQAPQAVQANSSPAQTSSSVALGQNGLPLRSLPTGAARLQAVMETVQAHAPEPSPEGAAQTPQLDAQALPTLPNRPRYTTEVRVVVVIDAYDGVPQHETRNGLHEYAEARIVNVLAVAHPENFDANDPRIHLAMNVASAEDKAGLPREIPLQPGQQLEVQGEYIPADHAHGGGPAVLHFTHSPAGYVTLNGQTYA